MVVYSTGDVAHEFRFATEEELFEPRKKAKMVNALFTVSLGPGTAYVLDPVDDLTFTHEAAFAKGANGKWRKAYVFRWLHAEKDFYADTRGMVVHTGDYTTLSLTFSHQ